MNERSQAEQQYSYPVREHLDPLETPGDWIDDEVRFAGRAGREVRDTIYTELHSIYRSMPYVQLLKSYADRLNGVQLARETAGAQQLPLRGQSLYSGMLLAVRSELMPAQYVVRQQALHANTREVAEQIERGYNQSVRVLERLPGDTRTALGIAARILFVDLSSPEANRYRMDFITGYAASTAAIEAVRQGRVTTVNPIRYAG